jgi:hypothetical protein
MTRFNTRDNRAARTAVGPLTAGHTPVGTAEAPAPVVNHQGGIGYTRDARSDLYLLAVTSHDLTAETFYESGGARVERFDNLVRQVAVSDPDWTYRFLTWLRTKGNIRTAAVVGGIEAAAAMAKAGIPGGRHMVSTVLRRADEPGEAIAYYHARYGRKLPMPVKRGVADAATRLYNERSVLKYDTASHAVRFADVLALTHAKPKTNADTVRSGASWQSDLFAHIIDRRYGRDEVDNIGNLSVLTQNLMLRTQWAASSVPPEMYTADAINAAGMTWEDALSALGSKVDNRVLWRNLIPSMGFMARLRNLRNFDQAGLADADVADVVRMLSDPDAIRNSRQLPLRFLSAYRAAEASLRWQYPLSRALDIAVENIPALPGRTLILVDTSGSMHSPMSDRSQLMRWDAAASFGLALARRCADADLVSYSGSSGWNWQRGHGVGVESREFMINRSAALLHDIARWKNGGWFIGGGTDTVGAVRKHFAGHDRVVILTDEQDGGSHGRTPVGDSLPATTPLYTLNLAGYSTSHAPTNPYRIVLGGLTDQAFGIMSAIESGADGAWPWAGDSSIGGLPVYSAPDATATR